MQELYVHRLTFVFAVYLNGKWSSYYYFIIIIIIIFNNNTITLFQYIYAPDNKRFMAEELS